MAHKGKNEVKYLLGIAGFFLGHVIFIWHAMLFIPAFGTPEAAPYIRNGLTTAAVLAIWFTPYLLLRVIRKVPKLLRLPVVLYTFISIASLGCAVMTSDALYILGIAMLLFSDTMIAESDFVGNPRTGRLILPTYYLCHILVAYSALI